MFKISHYLPRPVHPDSESQEKISHMYYALIAGLGISALIWTLAPIIFFTNDSFTSQNFWAVFVGDTLLLIGIWRTYRNLLKLQVERAMWSFLLFTIAGYYGGILASPDGFYDPGIYASVFTLITVSYYMTKKALLFYTSSITLLLVLIFTLEILGLKTTNHPIPTLFHLALYLSFLWTGNWFLNVTMQRLRKRTKELKQSRDELNLEKERAEMASVTKSRFLASMSHELRTPLNAIIGYSELIEEGLLYGESVENSVEDVIRVRLAARNLLELINNILDLSKVEADQMGFEREKLKVDHLIQSASTLLQPIVDRGSNMLFIDPIPPDLYVWGDEQKARQVLINLLTNANKFTDRGEIRIGVTLAEEWITISVSDSGIGIDESFMRELFEPFKQAENDYSRNYKGSGLGLAISKKFVQMMGGEIAVRSELGVGTAFDVTLPRVAESVANQKAVELE